MDLGWIIVIFAMALSATALADPSITRYTIDGGGGVSEVEGKRITGTIGQPDAGTLSAGSVRILGGFWPGIAPSGGDTPTPTSTSTPGGPTSTSTPTMPSDGSTPTPTFTSNGPTPTQTEPSDGGTSTPTSTPGGMRPTETPTPTLFNFDIGEIDGFIDSRDLVKIVEELKKRGVPPEEIFEFVNHWRREFPPRSKSGSAEE